MSTMIWKQVVSAAMSAADDPAKAGEVLVAQLGGFFEAMKSQPCYEREVYIYPTGVVSAHFIDACVEAAKSLHGGQGTAMYRLSCGKDRSLETLQGALGDWPEGASIEYVDQQFLDNLRARLDAAVDHLLPK